MSYTLDGKVAIITGSSSGLGESTALHFAKLGASVTLCGRNEQRLEAARQKCVEASGGKSERFLTVQGDVGESEVRNRIVDNTVAKFGQLDIVVSNHGGANYDGNLEKLTEENYDAIFSTNVKSVVFLLQRASPHLIKSKGCIVTISTIFSFLTAPDVLHYTMAKAALDHMSRTLSVVLGPKGVRVNNIQPGVFNTNFNRDFPAIIQEGNEGVAAMVPLKRLGENDEIAQAVGFLVSDNAKYITGAELTVSGGIHNINPMSMSALIAQ